jgi:cytochrome c biogenesis protein CcmG/thiol:disulfide interchange protein DsbE
MQSRRPRRAGWALALLAAASLAVPVARAAPAAGQAAPSLVVETLDGVAFDLAQHRGHVVIVNFWATWCPPCRAEMPVLDSIAARYGARGVEIIGLSVDRRGDRKAVGDVMRAYHYPAGLVEGAKANGFGAPRALPITYVVDAEGTIRSVLLPGRGALTAEMLEAAINPLLAPAPDTGGAAAR